MLTLANQVVKHSGRLNTSFFKPKMKGISLLEFILVLALIASLVAGIQVWLQKSVRATQANMDVRLALAWHKQLEQYLFTHKTEITQKLTAQTNPTRVSVLDLQSISAQASGLALSTQGPQGQTFCAWASLNAQGQAQIHLLSLGGQSFEDTQLLSHLTQLPTSFGAYFAQNDKIQGLSALWSMSDSVQAQTKAHALSICGTAFTPGHWIDLVGLDLFQSTHILHRQSWPGAMHLTQMQSPLALMSATPNDACATEDLQDTLRLAQDREGNILICKASGASSAANWQILSQSHWQEPVANFADLPLSNNQNGDVRMVMNLASAFQWQSANVRWQALSMDENGDLWVPNRVQGHILATDSSGFLSIGAHQLQNDSNRLRINAENFYVSGSNNSQRLSVSAQNTIAHNTLYANAGIVMGKTVTLGTACVNLGEVAKQSTGALAVCVSSRWTAS